MTEPRQWLEDRLAGLDTPAPPPELRKRVLHAAAATAARASAVDRWTRVWENRTLRLAWAACVLCLLAGHLLVSLPSHRQRVDPAVAVAVAEAEEDLVKLTSLPRLGFDVRPLAGRSSNPLNNGADATSEREVTGAGEDLS